MKLKIKFWLLTSFIVLVSCNENDVSVGGKDNSDGKITLSYGEYMSIAYDNPQTLTSEEIINKVKRFSDNLKDSPETKATNTNLDIKVVDKYYLDCNTAKRIENIQTKSNNFNSIPIYKVDIDGSKSSLVCGDERFPVVLTYVSKENNDSIDRYGSDDDLIPSEIMMQISINSALSNIKKINHLRDSLRTKTIQKVCDQFKIRSTEFDFDQIKDKILVNINSTKSGIIKDWEIDWENVTEQSLSTLYTKTRWNQGIPYNKQLPQVCLDNGERDYRYPTGCAVVCLAQVVAHLEIPMLCYGTQMNWTQLKQQPMILSTSSNSLITQVSLLMKYVGSICNAKYTCAGTTVTSIDHQKFLTQMNIAFDGSQSYNLNKIVESLTKKNIVIIRGENEKKEGHLWILDGFLKCSYEQYGGPKLYYVHANLGWGTHETGYYVGEDTYVYADGNTFNNLSIYTNVRRK